MAAIQENFGRYTPAGGMPELREAVARQASEELKVDFKNSNILVSAGAKMVLFTAIQSFVNPGDEVIIPAPYWVSYPPMVELADGVPVIVPCASHKLSAKELEGALTSKTKLLILNSPNNPSGQVYTKQELADLAKVLDQHPHIWVISDDIYNRLTLEGKESVTPHLLHLAPHLKDRVLSINGVSKTFGMTGWRLGWGIGLSISLQPWDAMHPRQSAVQIPSPKKQP